MDNKFKYLNDQWSLDDDLGICAAGDLAARMAIEAEPPFSMRIVGKWGSGKTSVLRRAFLTLKGQPMQQAVPLGNDLSEDHEHQWKKWGYDHQDRPNPLDWGEELRQAATQSLCIWYSPWQHQNADNPLIPLLLEIQAQFSARLRLYEKMKNFNRRGGLAAMTLLERLIDSAVSLFGKKISITGTVDSVRKAWREAAPSLTELSDGQRFHLLFEDAVRQVLSSLPKVQPRGQERLIIFIDDLDRCAERVIIDLLECIKLYLGSPHCVFILGIDDTAVLDAMKRCWSGRNEEDNYEYLEKMFQATLSVPLPRPLKIKSTIQGLLTKHGFPQPEDLAEIIENLLEPNPRKIKNFCNSLCASWNQFKLASHPDNALITKQFILFHYLRLYHRPVWRLLERQPRSLLILHRVLTQTPDQLPANSGFDRGAERALEELFTRSFLHVLRDDKEDKKLYRNVDLEKAVFIFQARLDNKRSDDYFVGQFIEHIKDTSQLPDYFLYLPEPETAAPKE